jgi:hypothetical protein
MPVLLDTTTYVSNDSLVLQRTGGASTAEALQHDSFVGTAIIASKFSILYERYLMRARWTVDDSLIEWDYPLVDLVGTYSTKPPGELADIVVIGVVIRPGYMEV